MALKPSIAGVHDFLRRNNGLIVHFSGAPPGVPSGANLSYPHDLRAVISGAAQSGLACSIVMPTDDFVGPSVRNAFGFIGVIVDLVTPDSLMAVDPSDAGSWVENRVRQYPDREITLGDLDNSLRGRTQHNEWGLQNYRVCGVLAVPPFEYWVPPPPGGPARTTPELIEAAFAPLPVFGFFNGQLISRQGRIDAGSIYTQ
jgi:hypothetical protein